MMKILSFLIFHSMCLIVSIYIFFYFSKDKPIIGYSSKEKPVNIMITSKKLMPNIQYRGIHHIDGTYKITCFGFPLLVYGVSDYSGHLYPVCLASWSLRSRITGSRLKLNFWVKHINYSGKKTWSKFAPPKFLFVEYHRVTL